MQNGIQLLLIERYLSELRKHKIIVFHRCLLEHGGDCKDLTQHKMHTNMYIVKDVCYLTDFTASRKSFKSQTTRQTHRGTRKRQTHWILLPPSGQLQKRDSILHSVTAAAHIAHLNLQLANGLWLFWAFPLRALQVLLALKKILLSCTQ